MDHFSSQGVFNNATLRDGYTLKKQQELIPIELFIDSAWIPFTPNEKNELNIKLLELHNTSVYLDNIWNRGEDIYFSFHTKHHMNYWGGEFLYNGIFNENGTFTSPSQGEIILYDNEHNTIPLGGTGFGPGADFSFGVMIEDQHNIENGFYVNYTGFILYEYGKR